MPVERFEDTVDTVRRILHEEEVIRLAFYPCSDVYPGRGDHLLHVNAEPFFSIELTLLLVFLTHLQH